MINFVYLSDEIFMIEKNKFQPIGSKIFHPDFTEFWQMFHTHEAFSAFTLLHDNETCYKLMYIFFSLEL